MQSRLTFSINGRVWFEFRGWRSVAVASIVAIDFLMCLWVPAYLIGSAQ